MNTWKIDNMHSEIGFKVRHMMISNVSGSFKTFDANLTTSGDDFSDVAIDFTAQIGSISTGVQDRDGHLLSADFFDAEKFPTLEFKSTSIDKNADSEWHIHGDLTLKGITHPVVLRADFAGIATDPYGKTKTGMSIHGKIKRSDFGLTWSAVTEAGNVVLGDEITLQSEVQFVKQA